MLLEKDKDIKISQWQESFCMIYVFKLRKITWRLGSDNDPYSHHKTANVSITLLITNNKICALGSCSFENKFHTLTKY